MNSMLRRRDVEAATGLSRAAIYARMAEGSYPKPMKIGKRAVAWRADEVQAWLAARARGGPGWTNSGLTPSARAAASPDGR